MTSGSGSGRRSVGFVASAGDATLGANTVGNTRGRYVLDRNRIKIETPFARTVYQMEFSGDRMILREPNGLKLDFTRVR